MRRNRAWLALLLVLVIAGTGFLYWPRSLSALIGWEHPLQVIKIAMELDEAQLATLGSASYALEPGSQEQAAVKEILSRYRWHLGFDTLFNMSASGFKGKTALQFSEMTPGGKLIEVAEGSGRMAIEGRAAKIGYFGAGDAKKLVGEVLEILKPLTPQV